MYRHVDRIIVPADAVRRVRMGFLWVLVFGVLLQCASTAVAAVLPSGFTREQVSSNWSGVVGLTFAADGRMFAWERAGRVWIVDTNGVKSAQPLIDISDEVGGWRDYGLLGFTLHPNFLNNGYIYLLYVVDHHHLINYGTGSYDPSTDEYFMASIGRITRYTARAVDNFESVEPSSRLVLLGESITNGFPIVHQSHGVGTLLFGVDGTLLASCGDGASYSGVDTGGAVHGSYAVQALGEGIIRPKEDIGALRSQLVDCLSGKIVRIDPITGNGVPSNPFYDALDPRAPRSRVWALGLRNPFRMGLRDGSGSHDPNDGDPGTLYIGDVGWTLWEDLNVCTNGGQNFGWPIYEGMLVHNDYYNANVYNLDAPNPLNGVGGCSQEYFYARDLLKQQTLNTPSWPNPCDVGQQVPASIPRFTHSRPAVDWKHGSAQSRTGAFDTNGNAVVYNLNDPGSPVPGPNFAGNSSTGGTWYEGDDFPAMYKNTYFHGDYGQKWIRNFVFDTNDNPVLVRDFMSDAGGVVFIGTHPDEGNLYYIEWGSTVWKISYAPGVNQAPVAAIDASPPFGPAPLSVDFAGTNSTDPDGVITNYSWDFGDGSTTNGTDAPSHVFAGPGGLPTNYLVTLVVQDDQGALGTNTVWINVNNSPPSVAITSPTNGTLYPLTNATVYPLEASVADTEHTAGELSYAWITYLHHNDHNHSEPVDTNVTSSTLISPIGCGEETYFYRVTLTVTDPLGLSGEDEVYLYPDCPPPTAPTSLIATALSGSSIQLTWQDTSFTESGFSIERSYDGTNFVVVSTNAPNQTEILDSGLLSDTTHHYRVQAYSEAGMSAYSGVASATTLAGQPAAFLQDTGPDGLVVMEVESFDANVPQGAHAWTTNLTAGYSGTAALESTPNSGVNNNTGYALSSPRLDFEVSFAKTGTHYVWVRGIGATGSDDSCHAGLNGAEIATSDRISSFGTGWSWSKTTMDSAADATFGVATQGVQTVNLWMREDGFVIDRLLLTTSPGYTPAAAGPAESPRNTLATPPAISAITNQVMEEDAVLGPIGFSVTDNETYGENLLVSITSSDTNLIHPSGMTLDGFGTNQSLTLSPVPDQAGVSTITVTVSDGYLATNETFDVTVTPVNDPPAFDLTPTNRVMDELTLMTVTNSASDIDNPAHELNYSLIGPPAGATVDTNGVIRWTPSELQGPSTNTLVTVVDDGQDSITNSFVVTVLEVNVAPIAFADALARFVTQGVNTPASNLLTNDTDGDGDTLALTGVISPTPLGATVSTSNLWVSYQPIYGETNADTFNYLIADGKGGVATGLVTVSVQTEPAALEVLAIQTAAGDYALSFTGLPGFTYTVQYTDTWEPANWQNLQVVTADEFGVVQLTDDSSGSGPSRFYRAVRGSVP